VVELRDAGSDLGELAQPSGRDRSVAPGQGGAGREQPGGRGAVGDDHLGQQREVAPEQPRDDLPGPIDASGRRGWRARVLFGEALLERVDGLQASAGAFDQRPRSEEHTSELQSRENIVCRLLLEKKKIRRSLLPMTYS